MSIALVGCKKAVEQAVAEPAAAEPVATAVQATTSVDAAAQ